MISTKNLYICELCTIESTETIYPEKYNSLYEKIRYSRTKYTSAKAGIIIAKKEMDYIDIITKSSYPDKDDIKAVTGETYVNRTRPIITNKKYLTKKEIEMILKELNSNIVIIERPNILRLIKK